MASEPASEKTNTNRFYSCGGEGITYSTVDEIAWFIYPSKTAIQEYSESMIALANVHAAWGDFKGMRDNLNFLVDVRIKIAELLGENYLS